MPLKRISLPPSWSNLLSFVRFVAQRVNEGRCLQVAGSLSFTTLLALVPFVTLALALLSPFAVFDQVSIAFKSFLLKNLVPDVAGRVITVYMRQFTDNAARLTLMGVVVLAFTAVMLISTIDKAFAAIWQVKQGRRVWQQLMLYWTVLTLLPIFTGFALSLTNWLFDALPSWPGIWGWLSGLLRGTLRLALSILTFSLVFFLTPARQVPWRHALVGGAFTGILFGVAQFLFGIYVKKLASFKLVYGAFASLPIFLAWLYLLWALLLTGATLTACLAYWQGGLWRRRSVPGRQLLDALRLLARLREAHLAGQSATTEQLRKLVGVGHAELLPLLAQLETRGWVQRLADQSWSLGQDLEAITVLDLYRTLVWDTDALQKLLQKPDPLSRQLAPLIHQLEAILQQPVSALAEGEPQPGTTTAQTA